MPLKEEAGADVGNRLKTGLQVRSRTVPFRSCQSIVQMPRAGGGSQLPSGLRKRVVDPWFGSSSLGENIYILGYLVSAEGGTLNLFRLKQGRPR